MYKARLILIVCALISGFSVAIVQAQGEELDAAVIIETIYEAVEARDLAAAGDFLADDVVLVLNPGPEGTAATFVGKNEVLGWFEHLTEVEFTSEMSEAETFGNRFTVTNKVRTMGMPVSSLDMDGAGVVQDGKAKVISMIISPESKAALHSAIATLANERLVRQWLSHWDTVNGELDGIDEILSEDFVSHNMPQGDREIMIEDVAAFRADHPRIYFSVDNLVVADGTAFLMNRMWELPEDAKEGDEGEPISPPFLTVLEIKDGKITERTLYAPLEP